MRRSAKPGDAPMTSTRGGRAERVPGFDGTMRRHHSGGTPGGCSRVFGSHKLASVQNVEFRLPEDQQRAIPGFPAHNAYKASPQLFPYYRQSTSSLLRVLQFVPTRRCALMM